MDTRYDSEEPDDFEGVDPNADTVIMDSESILEESNKEPKTVQAQRQLEDRRKMTPYHGGRLRSQLLMN